MKKIKEEVQQEIEKKVESVQNFKNNNKKLLIGAGLLILAFLIYGTFSNDYHKKEIKALESEISEVQEKFEAAVEEKERLRDSSEVYENLAEQAGEEADKFRAKAARPCQPRMRMSSPSCSSPRRTPLCCSSPHWAKFIA